MKKPLAPPHDCPFCPRLVAFRKDNRRLHPDWFNAPVPSFGPLDAKLLIAGLAPGLDGANRTGRPFTGDWAGDLLYATLLKRGLARGQYEERADDTLELVGCRIANSVRCVPPQNKPEPAEIKSCGGFLASEISSMPNLMAILALGQIAHNAALTALGQRKSSFPFRHGAVHAPADAPLLADSYHCSRYNTNTGTLTGTMFESVFAELKKRLA